MRSETDGSIRQAICIKWGTAFDASYVNRLYAMVARNITGKLRFCCFTDDPTDLRSEIVPYPLPVLGVPHPKNTRGKWRKTPLWRADLPIQGPTLFLDLDCVIVANIDPFFDYGDPADVILGRDWLNPIKRFGQTSVFRFPAGEHGYVYDDFVRDPQGTADRFRWEQRYVTASVRPGIKFWPRAWLRHYRKSCLGSYLRRYLRPARLPHDARIITFPGEPNPLDAMLGQWKPDPGPLSAGEHLKRAITGPFIGGSRLKHLKSFQRPCPWVSEHWRE